MFKTKYVVIGLVLVSLMGLGGITFFIWKKNKNAHIIRSDINNSSEQRSQVLSNTREDKTQGLQIAPDSSANNLGQMPQNNGTQPQKNPTSNSGTNVSGNSEASILDPATYKQYNSYKDDKAALFKDLLVGEGGELTANKKASVLYRVWLTNGTLVDSSRPNEQGELQPFTFTVGALEVIQAWDTSLTGMKVGGVRFLVVPPSVGYGSTPKGNIPANSVLIFQIQLLAVE